MDNENKMDALVKEIQRIAVALEKSEANFDKKRKRLNSQLVAFEKAIEILKSR